MIKHRNTILYSKLNKCILMLTFIFGINSGLVAQNVTVTGVVTGSDGGSIPMASIVIEGTDKSSVSDAMGKYSVSAPK